MAHLRMKRVGWSAALVAVALIVAGAVVVSCREGQREGLDDDSAKSASSGKRSRPFAEVAATVPWTMIAGPLRVSSINPRYFTNSTGRAVYLTGSHTWPNFQDGGVTDPPRAFTWIAYLDMLRAHHLNIIKLWRFEQAKYSSETAGDFYLEPSPYLRPGPGTAIDGKPKFDLTRFNQAYFDRMRQRIIEARARGIYVAIMLFDGWSVEAKLPQPNGNPWLGHPYNVANNINGIDGDINHDNAGTESHTLAIPAVLALQEAYVRKVVDMVNDLDNVLYEISNEDRATTAALAWQYHLIDFIHGYEAGKPKQHPVGMTSVWPDGENAWLFASEADWIAPSGSLRDTPSASGAKVILNDTDHLCGVCGDVSWVWKSFARGTNPMLMDPYDGAWPIASVPYDIEDPRWEQVRRNLGYARSYADRMNLLAMRQHDELASTGYCLANPASAAAEYLVYLPSGGSVTVNLSASAEALAVEWFFPATGRTIPGTTIMGGASRTLAAPSGPDAVLYIHR
jgi:hypothetical protein